MTTSISATGISTPAITSGLYNSGQLAGFRNKIINGNFSINQRGYVSGNPSVSEKYTFDRWRTSGTQGFTYDSYKSGQLVTIPSGQTLKQTINFLDVPLGTYVLSWEGTSQGRINGGAYGTSGSVTLNQTTASNVIVEFNTGTLSHVQLEPGDTPTPFDLRPRSVELLQCMYFYENFTTAESMIALNVSDSTNYTFGFRYTVPKRSTPTIAIQSNMTGFGAPSVASISLVGFRVSAVSGITASARIFSFAAQVEAEL